MTFVLIASKFQVASQSSLLFVDWRAKKAEFEPRSLARATRCFFGNFQPFDLIPPFSSHLLTKSIPFNLLSLCLWDQICPFQFLLDHLHSTRPVFVHPFEPISTANSRIRMDYTMEDTQNSAPGSLPAAQAAKLGAPRKAQDVQSTTKRLVSLPLVTH